MTSRLNDSTKSAPNEPENNWLAESVFSMTSVSYNVTGTSAISKWNSGNTTTFACAIPPKPPREVACSVSPSMVSVNVFANLLPHQTLSAEK